MKVLIERCDCKLIDPCSDSWPLPFRVTIDYDDGWRATMFERGPGGPTDTRVWRSGHVDRLRKMFELAGADVTVDI